MNGFINIHPQIEKIDFRIRGNIRLFLKDGRKIEAPLKYFPTVKRLTSIQRNQYHIIDEQVLMFDDCDEIFHIEQFLGKEQHYRYNFKSTIAAEKNSNYKSKRKI